jgi:hypothetical protein
MLSDTRGNLNFDGLFEWGWISTRFLESPELYSLSSRIHLLPSFVNKVTIISQNEM